jgi:peptidyl-prolyl isomerase D
MNGEIVLRIATELKEFGNKAFKAGDIETGLDKYQKGLRYLTMWPTPEDSDPPEVWGKLQTLRFTLHNNSALLHNKQKNWRDGNESASKALAIEGISGTDKAKALYRRATAKISQKDDDGAFEDLAQAESLQPGDAAITRDLEAARKRIADKKAKEKAAIKKFFS